MQNVFTSFLRIRTIEMQFPIYLRLTAHIHLETFSETRRALNMIFMQRQYPWSDHGLPDNRQFSQGREPLGVVSELGDLSTSIRQ